MCNTCISKMCDTAAKKYGRAKFKCTIIKALTLYTKWYHIIGRQTENLKMCAVGISLWPRG